MGRWTKVMTKIRRFQKKNLQFPSYLELLPFYIDFNLHRFIPTKNLKVVPEASYQNLNCPGRHLYLMG